MLRLLQYNCATRNQQGKQPSLFNTQLRCPLSSPQAAAAAAAHTDRKWGLHWPVAPRTVFSHKANRKYCFIYHTQNLKINFIFPMSIISNRKNVNVFSIRVCIKTCGKSLMNRNAHGRQTSCTNVGWTEKRADCKQFFPPSDFTMSSNAALLNKHGLQRHHGQDRAEKAMYTHSHTHTTHKGEKNFPCVLRASSHI